MNKLVKIDNGTSKPPASRPRQRATRPSRAEAEQAVSTLIRWAGDDPDREGLTETPARVVRAYRLEGAETSRANAAFRRLYSALMSMTISRSRIDPLLEVLGGAAVAAVIGFAGWRAAMGTGTLGNFTGFVAALLIASRPLRALRIAIASGATTFDFKASPSPSARRMRVALGGNWMPAPASSSCSACSSTTARKSLRASASAVVSPAMPPPATRIVRDDATIHRAGLNQAVAGSFQAHSGGRAACGSSAGSWR